MRISRADRSIVAGWWFTFDRVLLVALLALVAIGIVLSLAASPAAAVRKGLPAFYFAQRHIGFACIGVLVMIAVSMLTPRLVRRLALIMFLASIAAMIFVLYTGDEINGARRWLRFAGVSLQPSEFAKPAFAVIAAWAFAESELRKDMPGLQLAIASYLVLATLLVLQPDIGQTMLITAVFAMLLFASRCSIIWGVVLAGLAAAGSVLVYLTFPHVRDRMALFMSPVADDNSQLDRAFKSFAEGGFFGRGPGEGTIKTVLPDAHTDFIFAVVAEEYGGIACLAIVALFAIVVLRPLLRAIHEADPFIRHGITALAAMVGLQALINMAVNVGLVPAKGLTLPFISAGGSSTLAMSIGCGMLLALSRHRPNPTRIKLPGSRGKLSQIQPLETGST